MVKRKTKKTRNASLGDQLSAMHEAIAQEARTFEPLQTNWSPNALKLDINPEDAAGTHVERRLEMRPSIDEIMREIEEASKDGGDGFVYGGERGKLIIGIGKLRFSDGTQTEKTYAYGPDEKLIQYDRRMEAGAMLGCREKQSRMLGGEDFDITNSNRNYTAVYGGKHAGTVARKPREEKEAQDEVKQIITRDQAAAMLAKAYENTLVLPPVKRAPTGFAYQPQKLRDAFCGLEKTPKGESGSVAWVDISGTIAQREAWHETMHAIREETKQTLDRIKNAKTLADISPGGTDRGARKRAHRLLVAANDNIASELKKSRA